MLATASTALAAEPDSPVAYTNAAIETAAKSGRIENGTLLVRDGKIDAVGANVKIPDDARVIDARGKTIMPGLLDPFREVTIAGAASDATPRTIVVGGRSITFQGGRGGGGSGFTRIADNFNPYDTGYKTLLRSGLTSANLVTAGYGQAAVIRVTPGEPESMLVQGDGILFTAVSNDSASLDLIRTGLEMADRAKKGQAVSDQATRPTPMGQFNPGGRRGGGGGRRQGGGSPGGGFGGTFSTANLKQWQEVYDGKSPLFANAANAAAILHLLKAIEPYKSVKFVLIAPGPALYETVDSLAGKPVKLIIRPGLSLVPNTRDRIDMAGVLNKAGLEFAFMQPASQADLLAAQDSPLFSVAYLVRSGLPRQVALEALTARPAALLGLDKTHGTLEPGKSADLLIFAGDPFDPSGSLTQVLIQGRSVYEN
jgi:hypothetical protein